MAVPLYMDHDSGNKALVLALQNAGVDVLTTEAAGNRRLDDAQQLAFATSAGRIIYTGNRRDFARLNAQWARSNREHAGIVTRTRARVPFRLEFDSLIRLCMESVPSDVRNLIFYI
jgi:hypothetical protein